MIGYPNIDARQKPPRGRFITRRLMLLSALALCGSLGAFTAPRIEHVLVPTFPITRIGPGDRLSGPAVLVNISKAPKTVEVNLTAAVARMSLQPGVTSEVFAYNGRVPGPTLDVREGDKVIVHFRNDLPEATTVHWHGIHLPYQSDGSPYHPVAPGTTRDYVFTVPQGSAGTYWYHPHPDHRTGYA
ncbi:MAG TPA: multicopper oxidase domain-containing protein, partial [Gemmatimonadaceae bacterium]|nr:multicopper oxidase domain-containing protein [Gemmatimonadaceae bacterium]